MTNSPSSTFESSFSSSESPQITIRRPADFHVAMNPTTPHSNPYPREAFSSPFQIQTPVIITPGEERSIRNDKTETAIELECDQFEVMLAAFNDIQIETPDAYLENVPSDSSNCAKLREINRLEAIDFAVSSLTTDCENEIQQAIDLLEWNIGQMTFESDLIETLFEKFDNEKNKKQKQWEQIELILNVLKSL